MICARASRTKGKTNGLVGDGRRGRGRLRTSSITISTFFSSSIHSIVTSAFRFLRSVTTCRKSDWRAKKENGKMKKKKINRQIKIKGNRTATTTGP